MVMSVEPDIAYEPVGIISSGKKARSCCGCCCDMRRAVIVVDIILLIGRALAMLGVESLLNMQLSQGSINVGNNTTELVVDHDDEVTTPVSVILVVLLGVCCAGLSIYGAITYNKYMVAANAIFLVVTVPFGGVLSFVVNGLYLYPHLFLIYYIHTGVITKENYANEKQSCCCV